jgi:hypothetical protein
MRPKAPVNATDQKPKPDRFGKRNRLEDSPRRETAAKLRLTFIFGESQSAMVNVEYLRLRSQPTVSSNRQRTVKEMALQRSIA